jgi:hypothetical protein
VRTDAYVESAAAGPRCRSHEEADLAMELSAFRPKRRR